MCNGAGFGFWKKNWTMDPKANSPKPLKIGAWEIVFFSGFGLFSGTMSVSWRVVCWEDEQKGFCRLAGKCRTDVAMVFQSESRKWNVYSKNHACLGLKSALF